MDLPPSGRSAAKKKTFVSWRRRKSGERRCQSPKPERGAEASTACLITPRGAAQAGLTEGAERSLEFARKRMSKEEISRRLFRVMCSWPACREALHGSIRQAASSHRGAVRSVDGIAPGGMGSLFFDYQVKGSDHDPSIRPIRALDDDVKTYIVMSAMAEHRELPTLVIHGVDGKRNGQAPGQEGYITSWIFSSIALPCSLRSASIKKKSKLRGKSLFLAWSRFGEVSKWRMNAEQR